MGLSMTSARILRCFTISSRSPVRRPKFVGSTMLLDDAGGSSGDMIGLACCFAFSVLAGGGPFDLLHPTIRKEARHNAEKNASPLLQTAHHVFPPESISATQRAPGEAIISGCDHSLSSTSRPKYQSSEFFLAHRTPKFPPYEEGNKNAKHNDTAAGELVEAYVPGSLGQISSMDQPFDDFLDDVKGEHEQPEHKRLPHRGNQKCLVLVSLSKFRVFSDHNDLGDHRCIDQCESYCQILHVVLLEQEHVVDRESAEKEGQVKK